MEILNRNIREQARWRLAAMVLVVLACNAVILLASDAALVSFGSGGQKAGRESLEMTIIDKRASINHERIKVTELQAIRAEWRKKVDKMTRERDRLMKEKEKLDKKFNQLSAQ